MRAEGDVVEQSLAVCEQLDLGELPVKANFRVARDDKWMCAPPDQIDKTIDQGVHVKSARSVRRALATVEKPIEDHKLETRSD